MGSEESLDPFGLYKTVLFYSHNNEIFTKVKRMNYNPLLSIPVWSGPLRVQGGDCYELKLDPVIISSSTRIYGCRSVDRPIT